MAGNEESEWKWNRYRLILLQIGYFNSVAARHTVEIRDVATFRDFLSFLTAVIIIVAFARRVFKRSKDRRRCRRWPTIFLLRDFAEERN